MVFENDIKHSRYLRHYYKYKGVTKKVSGNVYYKAAYKCNRRWMDRVHLKTIELKRCTDPEVSVRVLDPFVWEMIEESILKPKELKDHLVDWESEVKSTQMKMEKELRRLDQVEQDLRNQREQILDQYANGTLSQEDYLEKCLSSDIEVNCLKLERTEATKKIPILHKKEVIELSIKIFCETARARFVTCKTFDDKRRFVLEYVKEVSYNHSQVVLRGSIPLFNTQKSEDLESSKIEFSVEKKISNEERQRLRIQNS